MVSEPVLELEQGSIKEVATFHPGVPHTLEWG
jgi:hypothetical protein